MNDHRPKARTARLLVQEIGDEILVYDLERNLAHSFNGAAAQIWHRCDGTRTVAQIASLIAPSLPADTGAKLVWHALAQFEKEHLIEGSARMEKVAMPPRRELMLRLGLAAALIPVVDSIVSPPALHAQSGGTGATGVTAS